MNRLQEAGRSAWLAAWVSMSFGLCTGSWACSASQAEQVQSETPALGAQLHYSFSDFEGHEVSSTTMSGRTTLVVLVTTYDWASQLVLRRVNQTLVSFAPKINAFGVVLEPSSYAVLVPQFSKSLELRFPVVMGDVGTLDGSGPFAPIEYVPTVIVLDGMGRERQRLKGPITVEELTKVLRGLHPQALPVTP